MDRFLCQLCYTIVRCGENHPCFCYDDDNEPDPNDLEANNTKSALLEKVHSENFNDNSGIIYSNFKESVLEATSEETAENNEQISLLPKYKSLLAATNNNIWSLSSSDNSLLDSTTVNAGKNNLASKTFCSENNFEYRTTFANVGFPMIKKNLDECEVPKNLPDTSIATRADTGSFSSNINAKLDFKKSQEFRKDASAVAGVPVIRPSLQTTAEKRKHDNDLCPQKPKKEPARFSHNRKLTGEQRFECNTCKKRFTRQIHLENHFRTHTGERPFECDVCGERFSQKGNLERHLRIHTGEKPYGCDICTKTFNEKKTLVNHRRTHTGERPFECDVCGERFSQKGNLDRHRRIHAGEKP